MLFLNTIYTILKQLYRLTFALVMKIVSAETLNQTFKANKTKIIQGFTLKNKFINIFFYFRYFVHTSKFRKVNQFFFFF